MTITEFIERLKRFSPETEMLFSLDVIEDSKFFNTGSVHINYRESLGEYKCVLFVNPDANDPCLTVREFIERLNHFKEKHGDLRMDIWYDVGYEQYYPDDIDEIGFYLFQTGITEQDIINTLQFKCSVYFRI